MSLGQRSWAGIPVTLMILALVAAPGVPAFASGEDTQSADASKKSEKKTNDPAKAQKPAPAKDKDAAECKPATPKFNTFEDVYGARNWLLRASAVQSPGETTIVWREPVTAKPAAKSTPKKN